MSPSTRRRTRGKEPIDFRTCQKLVVDLTTKISGVIAQVTNQSEKENFDEIARHARGLKRHTDQLARTVGKLVKHVQRPPKERKGGGRPPRPQQNPTLSRYDGPVKFGPHQMSRAIVPTIQRVLEDRPEYQKKGWFKIALEEEVMQGIDPEKISNSTHDGLDDYQSQILVHCALDTRDETLRGRVSKIWTDSSKRGREFKLPNLTDLSPDMIEPDCKRLLRSTVGNATKSGKRIPYFVGPADSSPEWRDNVGLPRRSFLDCGDRLRMTPKRVPGIHTAYEYVSTGAGSSTAMHVEDAYLGSINLVLAGASKVWLFIPPGHREQLEAKLTALFEADAVGPPCAQFVRHLDSLFSPDLLDEWEIPYEIVACRAGEMIVTLSGTYHLVVNAGPNIAEAVNFTEQADWNVLPGQYRFCSTKCPLEYPLQPEDITLQDHEHSSDKESNPDDEEGEEEEGEDGSRPYLRGDRASVEDSEPSQHGSSSPDDEEGEEEEREDGNRPYLRGDRASVEDSGPSQHRSSSPDDEGEEEDGEDGSRLDLFGDEASVEDSGPSQHGSSSPDGEGEEEDGEDGSRLDLFGDEASVDHPEPNPIDELPQNNPADDPEGKDMTPAGGEEKDTCPLEEEVDIESLIRLMDEGSNAGDDDPNVATDGDGASQPRSNDSSTLANTSTPNGGNDSRLSTPPSSDECRSKSGRIQSVHSDQCRGDTSKGDSTDESGAPTQEQRESGLPSTSASSAEEAPSTTKSPNNTTDDLEVAEPDSKSDPDYDTFVVDLSTAQEEIEWVKLVEKTSKAFHLGDSLMRLLPGRRLNDTIIAATLQMLLPETSQVLIAKQSIQDFLKNGLVFNREQSGEHSPLLRHDADCTHLFIVHNVQHGSLDCNDKDEGDHWGLIIVDFEHRKVHVFGGETGNVNEAATLLHNIGAFINNYRASSGVQLSNVDWQDPEIQPLYEHCLDPSSYSYDIGVIARAEQFMHPERPLLPALSSSSTTPHEQLDRLRERYLRMFTNQYERVCSEEILKAHVQASPLAPRKRPTPDSPSEDRPPEKVKVSRSLLKLQRVPQDVEYDKLAPSQQWEDCLLRCANSKGFEGSLLVQAFRNAPGKQTWKVLRALQCMCEVASADQLLLVRHWQQNKKTIESSETSDFAYLHQCIKRYDDLDPHEMALRALFGKLHYYMMFEKCRKEIQSELSANKRMRRIQARSTDRSQDSTPTVADPIPTNETGRTSGQVARERILQGLSQQLEKAHRDPKTVSEEHNCYLNDGRIVMDLVLGYDPTWLLLFPLSRTRRSRSRNSHPPVLDLMRYDPPEPLKMLDKRPCIQEFLGDLKSLAKYFAKTLFTVRPELRDIDPTTIRSSNNPILLGLMGDDDIRKVKPRDVAKLFRRSEETSMETRLL